MIFDQIFRPKPQDSLNSIQGVQLSTINDISALLNTKSSLENTLKSIAQIIPKVLGCRYVGILMLKSHKHSEYRFSLSTTSMPATLNRFVKKAVGGNLNGLPYVIKGKTSIFAKSVKSKKIEYTKDLYQSFLPIMPKSLASALDSIIAKHMQLLVSIPLLVNDETLGVVALGWKNKYITDSDRVVMSTFANLASTAIHISRLFEEKEKAILAIKEQNSNLRSIFNLVKALNQTFNSDEVAKKSMNGLPQKKFLIGGILCSYNAKEKTIQVWTITKNKLSEKVSKLVRGFSQYIKHTDHPDFKNDIYVRAIKTKSPVSSTDMEEILRPIPNIFYPTIQKILKIKSVVAYPVVSEKNKAIAVVSYFIRDELYEDLSYDKKELLSTYTNQISIALGNAIFFQGQRKAVLELDKKISALKEARRKERDIIDIMGHELRTPMSIIQLSHKYIREKILPKAMENRDPTSLEKLEKYQDRLEESIKREICLLETLSGVTKVDNGKLELRKEPVNILEIIETGIQEQKKNAEEKNLRLSFKKPGKNKVTPEVNADKVRIQQIFDNLLSNAVKYTSKGGVKVTVDNDSDYVKVDVQDTGEGIPEEAIKNLGKKFFRVNQYIKDSKEAGKEIVRPGGTGLGLYLTFSLVKAHGGKIWVESQVGKGSIFHFTVPVYKNHISDNKSKSTERDVFKRYGLKK
ncbi:hypothetical protein JW887_05260 [Candidatus Dojkabacteria bacterium]|nr:hypothetical protein [Candidatus Dojkabacteria bacterium]